MACTVGAGFLTKVGIKKGGVWGTAVDVNEASQGIEMLNESVSAASNLLEDDSLTGSADGNIGVTGAQTVSGSIDFNLQYSSNVLMTLIAMCMGRADTPRVVGGLGAEKPYPYYWDLRLGDCLEGYFVTLAMDKQIGSVIHEYDSVKINGMTISGAAGSFVTISFDLIGRRLQTANTTTTSLGSATVLAPRKYIRFEDFKFRMKAQSGTALNADDQVYPQSFSITVNDSTVGDTTGLNSPYIDEPIRDAKREVTGNFDIPKYTDQTVEQDFLAGTVMKLSIKAKSNSQIIQAGGGPYYYGFEFYFPAIQITDAQRPVAGFGKIPASFDWTAKKADTAPAGMDGSGNLNTLTNEEARGSLTDSVRIETTNLLKTNPLA